MRDFSGCSLSKQVGYYLSVEAMSQTFAKRLSTGILAGFVTIVLLAGSPARSQDPADEDAPAEENADDAAGEGSGEPASAEAEGDEGGPAVGLDEIPELDRQTHEQDDDDFVPTEEIPVDQSIPFPTDI
jgi:hypothetical protein